MMSRAGMLTLGIALNLSGLQSCVTTAKTKEKTCELNGRIYKEGSKIMKDCNECECFDGKWLCTLMGCDDPPK
jgi:hypothetical protein